MSGCLVCGDPRTHAKDRCKTDYQYLRRNGFDRPFELISRLTERDIDRELRRARRVRREADLQWTTPMVRA